MRLVAVRPEEDEVEPLGVAGHALVDPALARCQSKHPEPLGRLARLRLYAQVLFQLSLLKIKFEQ